MSTDSPFAGSRPTERRRFGRRDTFKPAAIVVDGGATLACIVVNISQGGALLQTDGSDCAAERFDLLIEADDMIVACRVAHRTSGKIGVEFVASPRRASRQGTESSRRARIAVAAVLGRKA